MKKTRELYIPSFMEKVISMTGTELYMNTKMVEGGAKYLAMGFSGKKAKPDFYFTFISQEARTAYVNKWEDGIKAYQRRVQDRKDERRRPHEFKVGDVLYSTWGYDQTNVDFYQVVKVISPRMIEMREIAQDRTMDGYETGKATPRAGDAFLTESKPMRKMASADGYVHLTSYSCASKWDGRPVRYSSYA